MRSHVSFPFVCLIVYLLLCGFSFAQPQAQSPINSDPTTAQPTTHTLQSPEQILRPIRARLLLDFDLRLHSPETYARHVKQSCSVFPEGDLFPYIYPALAYVNIALNDPAQTQNSIHNAGKLIDLAIESVTRRIHPPDGDLLNLTSYQNNATYLGQLNLALGAYALLGDKNRYATLHAHLSSLLHRALIQSDARALRSFPEYSWPFDTIPVLVSLKLFDTVHSDSRSSAVIARHLDWIRSDATHPTLHLPYSRLRETTGADTTLPRGCDLSFRFCLLPHLDREYAAQLYQHYTAGFWIDHLFMAGFAEWPNGRQVFQDMDSGPIVAGIGLGATGLGLGATIASDDPIRLQRLCGQLATFEQLRPMFLAASQQTTGGLASDLQSLGLEGGCYTGFLFGDAMLFYCITWQPWF